MENRDSAHALLDYTKKKRCRLNNPDVKERTFAGRKAIDLGLRRLYLADTQLLTHLVLKGQTVLKIRLGSLESVSERNHELLRRIADTGCPSFCNPDVSED